MDRTAIPVANLGSRESKEHKELKVRRSQTLERWYEERIEEVGVVV